MSDTGRLHVYQIHIDGRGYDIRPTYASALERLANMMATNPRLEQAARAVGTSFPGPEISAHCDPVLFRHRAVASVGPGQQRIAVHDLDASVLDKTLVDWVHCLTEPDPTYEVLFGVYLVKGGFSTKVTAAKSVHKSVVGGVRSLRMSGLSDEDCIARLLGVQERMGGIAFVTRSVETAGLVLAGLADAAADRFLQIATELAL